MSPKDGRRMVYVKKRVCSWCRADINFLDCVSEDGEIFCSAKCQRESKAWDKEKDPSFLARSLPVELIK